MLQQVQKRRPPLVVVAPDSFKGTYSSADVAAAIARGLASRGVRHDVVPVADGGEGTLAALLGASEAGHVEHVTVLDALCRPRLVPLGFINGDGTAIIESAEVVGLGLTEANLRRPVEATTFGVGQLLRVAWRYGVERTYVAAGGTSTTDGGAGALDALCDSPSGGETVVLCDVETPYELAASTYGPQKGATPNDVIALEGRLNDLAAQFPRDPRGVARTGAGGGLAGALWAVHNAQLVSGADVVLRQVRLEERLAPAAAVITGEGRLDSQTGEGKLVARVAALARAHDVPCLAIVGTTDLPDEDAHTLGLERVVAASTLPLIEAVAAALADSIAGRS